MANGDFRTMTAGSEVANTLQQILARKRDTERQAMLDQLAADEQRSVQAARTADQTRLGKLAEAQLAESAENIFQTKRKGIRRGQTPESIQDEALREQLIQRGEFEELPVQGPAIDGGSLPPVRSFRGTQEEEETDLRKSLFSRLQGEAASPDEAEKYRMIEAGADPRMMSRRVPMTVFDPDRMKATTLPDVMVPEGDAFDVLPRKPIGYSGGAAALPKPWRVFDAQGKDVGSVSLSPADMGQWHTENPGFSLRPASFQAKEEPGVAATLRNQVTKARGDLSYGQARDIQDQGFFGKLFGTEVQESPETAAARGQLEAAVGQVLAADKTISPRVGEIFTDIMMDPELADAPVGEIITADFEDADGNPIVLSEDEKNALMRILMGFRGADITPGLGNQ